MSRQNPCKFAYGLLRPADDATVNYVLLMTAREQRANRIVNGFRFGKVAPRAVADVGMDSRELRRKKILAFARRGDAVEISRLERRAFVA